MMRKMLFATMVGLLWLSASRMAVAQTANELEVAIDTVVVDSVMTDTLVIDEGPKDRIDVIYYNRNWKVTPNKSFAEYYREALYPADPMMERMFRTYYITGEREGEGQFISLDGKDDKLSQFEGEVIRYYKNGNVSEKVVYENGVEVGEHVNYYDNGLIKQAVDMKNGRQTGLMKIFSEDGRVCRFVPYANGLQQGYYVTVDIDGNYSKYDALTDKPILEQPKPEEVQMEYNNGAPWPYYSKNGLIVGASHSESQDVKGYREITFFLYNKSLINVDLDPATVQIYTMKKGQRMDFEVMDGATYDKKVRKIQEKVAKDKAKGKAVIETERESTVNMDLGKQGQNAGQAGNVKAFQERMMSTTDLTSNQLTISGSRDSESLDYLARTTVHPGKAVSCYLYVPNKNITELYVTINIGGIDYPFEFK